MRIKLVILLCIVFILSACNDKVDIVPYEPQLVIEGSIENDKYASVLLSWSASVIDSKDTTALLSHVIKSAKITVSDGIREEVLLLKTNNSRLPPYEYVTRTLKGEIGKTYYLKIEYQNKIISAETFIPKPVILDSLWFVKKNDKDNYGHINARFKNSSKYPYQFSTQIINQEDRFSPCLYGNIDNTFYPKDEIISLQINKGPVIFPESSYNTHFTDTCKVQVKLSTQSYESYDFWVSYQNEILNSQNPIFPSTNRLRSNIKGGVGIWAGYGSSIMSIDLKQRN